jgi:carbon storage regulator
MKSLPWRKNRNKRDNRHFPVSCTFTLFLFFVRFGERYVLCARKERQMLVLSRQRDESIVIGDNVVVTVVDIRGDKVRLGIEAPAEIPIHRQEVYQAIQQENRKAAQSQPNRPAS